MVELPEFLGTNTDMNRANRLLAQKLGLPAGTVFDGKLSFLQDDIRYTWHHHQNGKHIMLVPSLVNQSAGHVGSASPNLRDNYVFPDPETIRDKHLNVCK